MTLNPQSTVSPSRAQHQQRYSKSIRYIAQQDIFIITKIRPSDLGYLKCKYTIPRFLEELSTSFLDLVLIHAPDIPPILGMAPSASDQKVLRDDTWRQGVFQGYLQVFCDFWHMSNEHQMKSNTYVVEMLNSFGKKQFQHRNWS